MATRSSITVKIGDKYHSIYSHWDGYPSHNGKILLENYNNQELAEKVVSLGDLSFLDKSMDKPDGHSYSNPVVGYSIAYGRDRGEEGIETKVYDSYGKAMKKNNQEYNYLWDGEKWLVNNEELTKEIIDNN